MMDFFMLETGRRYWVVYTCRDIGYGPESGEGEFVYGGETGGFGKHTFTPADGGEQIFLFPDEVIDAWPADKASDAPA
jgi:hypothetical protein